MTELSINSKNLLDADEPENEPREECGVFGVWLSLIHI